MRSVLSSMFSILGKVEPRVFLITCLLGGLGFSSVALAQLPQVQTPGVACAGTYNPNLSCTSNDIEINDVSQLLPSDDPRAQPPVTTCVAGEKVTLDIKFTTLLNANSRYDSLIWIGEEGQNPRGTVGTCYVTSLPDDPDSPFILDLDGDQCNDTNSSSTLPVDQYLFQVEVDCIDQYTPDPGGSNPDDVLPVPDGQLDVFFLITWFQNNSLNCGVGEGFAMEPGVNPKCDAALLTGINVEVVPQATIQVVKNSNLGTGIFSFTSDVPGLGNFDLDTTGDGTESTAVIALEGAEVGQTYNIAETIPDGWNLDSATCSNGETPDAVTPLDTQDVICTFTNTLDTATINIVKNTVGGNGVFAVNWLGPTTSGGVGLDTGMVNTDSDTIITTETGVFVLTELIPPGWVLGNAACIDDNGGGSLGSWNNIDTISGIDLSPGDSVTCTFTNQAVGTIMLAKNTIGGDGSFDFVTDVPGLGTNIQTSDGSGSATPATNVPTGTYSIVETVPAGWNLDSATCSNGNSPDSLVLTTGDTVTCTFVNTKLGTVIVEKQTLPDGSAQTFDFTGNVAGSIADGGQITLANLLPGNYTSTETVPAGWDLTSIVCDDGEPGAPSSGDINTGTATFVLDAGETVTCVFTNTQDGSIEVIKSLPLTGPLSETFNFTSSFNGNFQLIGDAATTGPVPVTPGSGYTVSEDDPSLAGWANTGASCGDGSDPLTDIVVSPGEAVVCTFTNTPLGSAVIIKDTVGGNGIFGFTGDAPIGPFSLDTTDQFTATTGDLFDYILTAGIYDVTEDNVPAGFELTNIECDDGSPTDVGTATASMDVQLAETVSCTFTNTADGTLIIRKETVPDGADQGFDFTGSAAGTIRDYSTFGEEIVVSGQPGIYTSAETVPAGWVISDISCTGNLQSGVTIGANDVSVNLAAGETVICTFENSVQGSITIEKLTRGGLGAFQFNSDLGSFLLDTSSNGNPDAATFGPLISSTYMFSEIVPSNWTLSDIQCSGATTSIITIGGAGGFDPDDQGVTIELNGGDSITCTFVNDADGSITVTKLTDPAGSTRSFDFSGAITASLTDGQTSLAVMVPPGNYDVSETPVAGWDTTDISCNDDDSTGNASTANFVVAPGEAVTCTFTNTIQRGNIVVVKETDPDGSAESFGFTSSYGGAFNLTDGQQNDSGPLLPSSEAGTYSVAEDAKAGWDLTSAVCSGDGNTPAAITLLPGETVTCTFTNTIQRGNIVVVKETDPDGSTEDFGFTSNYGGAFSLTDGQQNDSGPLLPSSEAGTYSVAEDAKAGWNLTSAVCSGDGNTPGAITLQPGETVTCTFTNTLAQDINLVKTASDPVRQANGSYTVVYTVTANNSGGPGVYDLTDTFTPAPGLVLNTAELTSYNPGTENSQTGTVSGVMPYAFANGDTIVTGEGLAAGLNESWTITANFTVVPGDLDGSETACVSGAPQSGQGFYNSVSGNIVEDESDNTACTNLPQINLAKTASGPTLEDGSGDYAAGTYTVVYTVTATNSGDVPSTYDLVDTLDPAVGLNLNSVELTNYTPGTENSQTGALSGVMPFTFSSGDTIVTNEGLAVGLNESWTITANFTVVPNELTPAASTCTSEAPVAGEGFYNFVSGNIVEDESDNSACVAFGEAQINLAKSSTSAVNVGGDTWEVVYTITATNSGEGAGIYDVIDTLMPGNGITPLFDASYPAIDYAGGEVKTGVVAPSPLVNGGTWVSLESLAGLQSESWTVTARFTVDELALINSPGNADCVLSDGENGTGYMNFVEGSATDIDLSDNETCVPQILPSTPVPTLSTWAMLLMILLMTGGAGWYFRPVHMRRTS